MDAAELSNDSSLTLWSVTGRGSDVRCVVDTAGGRRAGTFGRGTVRMLINGVATEARPFNHLGHLMALSAHWRVRLAAMAGEYE